MPRPVPRTTLLPALPSPGPKPPRPGTPSLWRDRDFRLLWVGQAASQLGEHSALMLLPLIAVLTLHADPGELGLLRAVGQVPILLFSLVAGAWVDRWRTRTVMVATDAGRALALGAAAVAGLLGVLGLPTLAVVAFAVGALSVFFDVAYQTALARLVHRDQLVWGNSALEGSRSAAQIGGPALGGALASLLSAPVGAATSAVFFAGSCLSIGRIRHREQVPESTGAHLSDGTGARSPVWRRIREGLRFVAADTSLRTCALPRPPSSSGWRRR